MASTYKSALFRRRLIAWFKKNRRYFPWREANKTPYEILIAEIFLQKTRAENVVMVYEKFIRNFPNPSSLANASALDIGNLIKPLGLHKNKSNTLIKLGKKLVELGEEITPFNLEGLPGVGKYTLNAVLINAFNKRVPLVDTNIKRIYKRVFSIDSKPDVRRDDFIWKFAHEMLPKKNYKEFTLALLDFSAVICKKKNPKCDSCPLNDICDYHNKQLKNNH